MGSSKDTVKRVKVQLEIGKGNSQYLYVSESLPEYILKNPGINKKKRGSQKGQKGKRIKHTFKNRWY